MHGAEQCCQLHAWQFRTARHPGVEFNLSRDANIHFRFREGTMQMLLVEFHEENISRESRYEVSRFVRSTVMTAFGGSSSVT